MESFGKNPGTDKDEKSYRFPWLANALKFQTDELNSKQMEMTHEWKILSETGKKTGIVFGIAAEKLFRHSPVPVIGASWEQDKDFQMQPGKSNFSQKPLPSKK